MADFSQSRGDDDLFDDEIVPFEETPSPATIAHQLEHVSLESINAPAPSEPVSVPALAPTTQPAAAAAASHNRVTSKPRGRGGSTAARGMNNRGGGGGGGGGLLESKWAPKPAKAAAESPTRESSAKPNPKPTEVSGDGQLAEPPSNAPGEEPESTPRTRPPAVRGDRTATGGVRKPKLTEEELSAKLAAAKERSQTLAAAHARAQADAAKFEERERIAEEKRDKDRVERKVMDKEREKNRQRKMAVMGGREWDAGKNEDDFRHTADARGGRRFQSGMTADEQYRSEQDDLKMYEWNDDRARGGRGRFPARGTGRGRGRQGRDDTGSHFDGRPAPQQQDLFATAEFPALPGSTMPPQEPGTADDVVRPMPRRWDSGAAAAIGSWAEQVESSEAINS